jgi:signal transduction histidine kinase
VLSLVICWGYCFRATGQPATVTARIVTVKAGNNQKDASFIDLLVNQHEPVRLQYDRNYLRFSFSNSKDPGRQSFSYKLSGLDYSWITCDNCSQAEFAHLDGGDYVFEVKTTQTGDAPAVFYFTIEGNIWHKWWFVPMLFFVFLIFLGVMIWFFVLLNFRQQLRQQRLVHKEKMASMSDLTAGIAHEIQNPLNFVNNFSELNLELIAEMQEELKKGNDALATEMSEDIAKNEEKIAGHGKRAGLIVTLMLEHSRINTGERQLTDINILADQYLQLAYQRALSRDRYFYVETATHFDLQLKKIIVIPNDIGRALMNIINNAFYAVADRKKNDSGNYKPVVTILTTAQKGKVIISVKDNGNGIPQKILDKIFQPFFTTKPTGQGTGLGLSLAYDIVKTHGGELKVNSKEGEGTEFMIKLTA